MGCGRQDEPARKSRITLDEKKGGVMSVGHFPFHSMVEIPDIRGASRHNIFCIFLRGNPILN